MLAITDAIEEAIVFEGPETVAAVYLEPVQNAGGCFVPPAGYFARVREICDKYGVLLVSDEVICAFGRLGHWFGAERYDYLPDMITCAKGITSGYAPLGAVICRDFLAEPFLDGKASFAHGLTFARPPGQLRGRRWRTSTCSNARTSSGTSAARSRGCARASTRCASSRSSATCRGAGFFWALELVKDQATKESFTTAEREELLRGFLLPRFLEPGWSPGRRPRRAGRAALAPAHRRSRGVRRHRVDAAHDRSPRPGRSSVR